jgi:CubicO group peptidase (beta-lactamase class C family)
MSKQHHSEPPRAAFFTEIYPARPLIAHQLPTETEDDPLIQQTPSRENRKSAIGSACRIDSKSTASSGELTPPTKEDLRGEIRVGSLKLSSGAHRRRRRFPITPNPARSPQIALPLLNFLVIFRGMILLPRSAASAFRRFAALSLFPTILSSAIAAPGFDKAAIEAQTPALMEKLHVPGVSIAIVENNRIAWTGTWGVKRADAEEKIDERTLFEAASMSKPLFAYAVLKLVEQNKLDPDRPLVEYLSKPYLDDEPNHKLITARMVLTHTTGFPNWRKNGWREGGPLSVNFKPGTEYGYSGEAFLYLQRVVERLTGEPLTKFMQRVLLADIGMTASSYEFDEKRKQDYSGGHDHDGQFKTDRKFYPKGNAAFTLYTTPSDYAHFLIEMMKPDRSAPHSLSAEMIEAMLKPEVKATGRHDGWRGLAWQIHKTDSGMRVSHGGSNGSGFRCHCRFYPDRKAGIVIMTNSYSGEKLWKALIEIVDP